MNNSISNHGDLNIIIYDDNGVDVHSKFIAMHRVNWMFTVWVIVDYEEKISEQTLAS